nr:ribonuclease H-like domain-containing protein [Tanacetum cinerariifolium]
MQKTILKQNYENFATSSQEGLDKTYDRFQKLISQLEIHGELDTKDFEQINTDDLEEVDLKWQVAMLTMGVKRFIQKIGRKLDLNGKETVRFDKTNVECYNCHRRCHFPRECKAPRNQENRNRDAPTRNAPVDISTTNALVVQDGIDSDVHTFSKECLKSYNALQKQYDQQRETLNKYNLEIIGYQIGLESLEARKVVHEKNEVFYEEDIAFLKYDVQVKDISIKDLKNQLESALKEKDDLKLKLEKFKTSFKNLTRLIDSHISVTDKTGLGYDGHVNESEVLNVVDSCESDGDDNQVNDRFKKSEGYHAIPSSYTGNYMPPRAGLSFDGLDDSVFKSKMSETITSMSEIETNASKTSKDSLEKPKTIRSSALIIEDWESDSEDENVFESEKVKKTVKPSLEKIEFVNARNITFKNENKAEKPRKFSHNPRVLTKSGEVPVNTAKQSSQRASVSTARHVNIAASRPNVNSALPTTYSLFKAHSLVRRPFNQNSTAKTNNFNEKVNTAKVNVTTARTKAVVSAAEGNRDNDVKSSACWIWRPKGNVIDNISKDSGSYTLRIFNYVDPQGRLEPAMAWKNSVLFTDTECVVLSPDFKLLDESQVLLKHGRLGHVNFKTMNKLVRGNHARGLPSKIFENDHTCVACHNEKQHKSSCKTKTVTSICKPLQLLHMDLFGPVSIKRNKKTYCLVVTDDFIRFTWVFSLATKDENPEILKNFIACIENQMDHKVKTIRCDNRTEFKNKIMNEFYEMKGIRREFSVARTPQQNGIAERKNRTLIEAARTMLADSKLPSTFWAEAVNTSCYIENKVLVIKPHNKTPYELFQGRKPALSFMRPFGCPVTILNTLDHLGKFDGKSNDEDTADTGIFSGAYDDEVEGAEADFNNLELTIVVSPILTTKMHKDHPKEQIIGDPLLALQTRRMTKTSQEHAMVTYIKKKRRTNHKDYQNCLSACFLSQIEPNKVYMCQPPGFEDPHFPNKVYKVEKVLYGLHQAPRAWYETLSTYLLENGFRKGIIDKTLFIKKDKNDIMLVQVYVDDIIFGSTKKSLCTEFEGLMHKKFQMSSMRELTFFLGLQVMQKDDESFISQDKYVVDILKKIDFSLVKTASTPIETNKALLKDEEAEDVDVHLYKSMIGSLMYLTASRPNIMFVVYACARFQVTPKISHIHAVKSDNVGASLDKKSTTGGCQFLGKRLISWQCKKQTVVANSTTEAEYVAAANCCGQKKQKSRRKQRQKTEVPHTKPQTKESVPTTSNDPLPSGEDRMQLTKLMNLCTNLQKHVLDLEKAKTAQAKEITNLNKRVKKLERKKKSRTLGLKRFWNIGSTARVESSEDKESLGDKENAFKQERMIDNIDQDEEIALVDETQRRMNEEEMFGVNDLDGDEVIIDATAGEEVEQSTKVTVTFHIF